MNHKVGFNKLGLKSGHRKALHRNMATSLFRYERITTTKAKALAVKRTVEKMITRAKVDSLHNRRIIAKDIKDKEILAKLFNELGPRYANRPGGYTRVLKLGWRKGDAAHKVILELVLDGYESTGKKKAKKVVKEKENNQETSSENKQEVIEDEIVEKKPPLAKDSGENNKETAEDKGKDIEEVSQIEDKN